MNKTALQFFGGAMLLVLAGAGAVWGIDYYRKIHSPEYQAQLKFQELEARARADTYGGATPEETLALFIDALKRGDIDLASKYFVVDEQEKIKKELDSAKLNKDFQQAITELEQARFTHKDSERAFLTLVDSKNIAISQMIFGLNPSNNKWKILEL